MLPSSTPSGRDFEARRHSTPAKIDQRSAMATTLLNARLLGVRESFIEFEVQFEYVDSGLSNKTELALRRVRPSTPISGGFCLLASQAGAISKPPIFCSPWPPRTTCQSAADSAPQSPCGEALGSA